MGSLAVREHMQHPSLVAAMPRPHGHTQISKYDKRIWGQGQEVHMASLGDKTTRDKRTAHVPHVIAFELGRERFASGLLAGQAGCLSSP